MSTDRSDASLPDSAVDILLEIGAGEGYECEVYAEDVSRRRIEVYRGRPESVDTARERGVGIRLASGGRTGFAWTGDLSPDGLRKALEYAVRGCEVAEPAGDRLAGPSRETSGGARPVGPSPPVDTTDLVDSVVGMERAALGYGEEIANIEGCVYSEARGTVTVASTRGIRRSESRHCCTCWTGAVAEAGPESRTGWYMAQATDPRDLDFAGTGRTAARRASAMLGGRPLPSGRYPVVFDATAFTEIVGFLAESLSGERAVRGTTVMKDLAGSRIAPGFFELVDDPSMEGGCYRASFDDEGVPCEVRRPVRAGVLEGFLDTSWSARRAGRGTGGNAFRSDFRGQPVPAPTNLLVRPGSGGLEELVGEMGEGLYIQEVMGMHTADPVSGDFSVGISGLRVRGGGLREAFCEMTLGGDLPGLLRGIGMIGAVPVFIGHCGSPPVLVEGLSAGGK